MVRQALARTLSKQFEQYTGLSLRGRNGTSAWPPHSAHTAASHLSLPSVAIAIAISRLPGDAEGTVLLCDRSTALATLRLVHQAFAGVELLLAR